MALGDGPDRRVKPAVAASAATVLLGSPGAEHVLELVEADDDPLPALSGQSTGFVERVQQSTLLLLGAELATREPGEL